LPSAAAVRGARAACPRNWVDRVARARVQRCERHRHDTTRPHQASANQHLIASRPPKCAAYHGSTLRGAKSKPAEPAGSLAATRIPAYICGLRADALALRAPCKAPVQSAQRETPTAGAGAAAEPLRGCRVAQRAPCRPARPSTAWPPIPIPIALEWSAVFGFGASAGTCALVGRARTGQLTPSQTARQPRLRDTGNGVHAAERARNEHGATRRARGVAVGFAIG